MRALHRNTMNIVTWLKSMMLSGGALPVMYLMIALSVVSVAIMLERAVVFASMSDDVDALGRDLRAYFASGDLVGALSRVDSSRAPEAKVVAAGLAHARRGAGAAEEAMTGAILVERLKLESHLSFLGTLGNNAPFVGLLGTVIGIVMAFERLGQAHASARAPVSAEVMSSIGEALVATALGLAVAIPAVAAYNYFQRRIHVVTTNADALSRLVLAHLRGDDVAEAR